MTFMIRTNTGRLKEKAKNCYSQFIQCSARTDVSRNRTLKAVIGKIPKTEV